MFGLYVFDLDGTLVDSRRDLADSANELLGECGGAALPEEQIGRMVGDGAAALVSRVFAAAGVAQPPGALARFLTIYDRRLLNHTRPYAGIPEALDVLQARVPLALLTNKPIESTRRVLEGLDLARHFDPAAVLGGDGPWPRKPDPAGLRHLSARANVPIDRTVLVGDSTIDLRTARAAGASICLARYGFGFGTVRQQEIVGDRTIDAPHELTSL